MSSKRKKAQATAAPLILKPAIVMSNKLFLTESYLCLRFKLFGTTQVTHSWFKDYSTRPVCRGRYENNNNLKSIQLMQSAVLLQPALWLMTAL